MSSKQGTAAQSSTKKKFGKGQREVPHHTQKAKKWYPAEDETQLKTVGSPLFLRLQSSSLCFGGAVHHQAVRLSTGARVLISE